MTLPRSRCLCGATLEGGVLLCAPCQINLPHYQPLFSEHRDLPIPSSIQCHHKDSHAVYDKHGHAADVDDWRVTYDYIYPVDVLIRRLKYHGALYLAAPLSYELARCCKECGVDGVMAIPQSATGWPLRGYNPALEIARRVARTVERPLWANGLHRMREARVQAGLGRVARQRNVADLFACTMSVQGLWVAVVDDVSTSGATLCAVANELKKQGARRVSAWVVARTPMPDKSI
jgi:predicted amidophosphoribosyltransferase